MTRTAFPPPPSLRPLRAGRLPALLLLLALLAPPLPAAAQSEKDINAINEIGLLYYNSGNYDEAVAEFKKILKMKPDHDVAHFNLGCVYQKMKNHKAALREFQAVLDQMPDDEESMKKIETVAKAWSSELEMELKLKPADPDLLSDLGLCELHLKEMEKAYEHITGALRVKPSHDEAHYHLSLYYMKNGEHKQAYDPAKKAAQLKPKNALYESHFRKLAQMLGMSTAVAAEPPKAVTGNEEEQFKKGRALFDDGKFEEAKRQFEAVVAANPKNADAQEYLKKIAEAARQASQLRDTYEAGDRSFKKELWEAAAGEFEKALKLDPGKSSPYYKRSLLSLAECRIQLGDYDRAEGHLNELSAQDPGDYKVLYSLGVIHFKRGATDRGTEFFKRALLSPNIDERTSAKIRETLADLEAASKAPYLYGGAALILLAVAGVVGTFLSPGSRKARLMKRLDENLRMNKWNAVIPDCEALSALPLDRGEYVKVNGTLARAHLVADNPDKAIMVAKRILLKDPGDKSAHEILAKCWFKKKVVNPEAILEYRKWLQQDRNNLPLLKMIGEYYVKQTASGDGKGGRGADSVPDDLLELFKEYAGRDGADVELVVFVANILRKRKDASREAIRAYEIALANGPENHRIREVLAKAYYDNKEFTKAIEECHVVFKENIGNTQTHRVFIDSHMGLGKYGDLLLEYEKMALAFPDNADIERRLAELKRQGIQIEGGGKRQAEVNYAVCLDKGAEFYAKGDMNKAIAELRMAEKSPQFKDRASILLIRCYLRKDLVDLARQQFDGLDLEKLVVTDEIKETAYELARVLEEKGQFKEALKLYNYICKVDIGFRDVFDKFEELHDYVSKF